jgi:hypothetical protein
MKVWHYNAYIYYKSWLKFQSNLTIKPGFRWLVKFQLLSLTANCNWLASVTEYPTNIQTLYALTTLHYTTYTKLTSKHYKNEL